jgi:hypothetical protein
VKLLILLAIVWFFATLRSRSRRGVPTVLNDGAGTPDPASAEPSVSDLLAEFRRSLEESQRGGRQGGPARRLPAPAAESEPEFVEEAQSLEVDPVVESLETDVARPERTLLDRGREAAEAVRNREKWVTDHAGPVTSADHRTFDRQIRTPPAADPAPVAAARPTLKQLVAWREILGPPVSLRRDGDV